MAEGRELVEVPAGFDDGAGEIAADELAFVALDFEDGALAAFFFELDSADACDFFEALLGGWSGETAGARGHFDQDRFGAASAGLQVLDGIRSDQLALINDDDSLAGLLDFGQDVGAEDDGVVACKALDEVARLVDLFGSRPAVGSSRMSTSGLWMMAWARPTRWR